MIRLPLRSTRTDTRFPYTPRCRSFVKALAILIFLAQLPELMGASWLVYVLVVAGLAIIYLLPLLTRAIPSPLVCIVLLSALALWMDLDVRREIGRAHV